MARPASLPVWATAGDIAEPGSGKKALGWVTGEQPPAQYFNWYQNLTYLWIEALAEENDDAPYLAASNTFTGALNTFTGDVAVSDDITANDDIFAGGDIGAGGGVTAAGAVSGASAAFGGTVTAASVAASGNVGGAGVVATGASSTAIQATNGGITVAGNVIGVAGVFSGNVSAGGFIQLPGTQRVQYSGSPSRERCVNLSKASHGSNITFDHASQSLTCVSPDSASLEIDLPNGALISTIEVIQNQVSNTTVLTLNRKTASDWSNANPVTTPTVTAIGTNTDSRTGAVVRTQVAGGGYTVNNTTETYTLRIAFGTAGSFVSQVRVVFVDPGPRND